MLKNYIQRILSELLRSKGFILIVLISLVLLLPSIFVSPDRVGSKQNEVLGIVKTSTPVPTSTPSLSVSPSPKAVLVVIPTPAPTVSATPTPAPTSTQTPTSSNNPSPSSTAIPVSTPTPSPSPTPTPTPVGLAIHVGADYAGQKSADSYTVYVEPGKKAWDAVVQAVGISNIQYDQYSFGIFITGINGVSADSNSQYYEFRVNGASSSVGVSDYSLNDGDQLDFVLTNF